jgi:cyclopropane-fatty-acyl-phospholipid synthase
MNTSTTAASLPWELRAPASARAALRLLEQLRHGTLAVHLPDGSARRFGSGEPHAALHLASWEPFARALRSGDIGFAESYVDGEWSTPALPELLALLLRNRETLESAVYGKWWGRLAYRLQHLFNRNSRSGSRRNIHAHYDLGNAFYGLWLDPTMNYSSAWFEGDATRDMESAQHAKVRRALRMANVQPGQRVLEIGCGWGALAEKAAGEFGAHVTGVTLSTEQLAFAQQRLAKAGLAANADLRLQDYRDISDAPFDAICSIEMVEAVGREWWPQYFASLRKLLKPGGRACVQSIVIADGLWDRRAAADAGLVVVDQFAFGLDYAETLRRWRERFLAEQAAVLAQGFDERFIRLWEFYLAYCEAAFAERNTDVVQFTLQHA